MSHELYSERSGNPRIVDQADVATLIWKSVTDLSEAAGFASRLEDGIRDGAHQRAPLGEVEFLRTLKKRDVYLHLMDPRRKGKPVSWIFDRDVMLDTLEYLHANVVAMPIHGSSPTPETIRHGQDELRDRVNPDLALCDPPMEMLSSGQVVEQAPDALRPLLDDPVPDDLPKPLRDPLQGAIEQYRRRGATEHDKRSALKHLADVLEPLRDDIDEHILPADEQALFQIANKFYLRHNDRDQQRSYDPDIWLDWIFYVYVATARALLATLDREQLRERVLGSPPEDNGGIPI